MLCWDCRERMPQQPGPTRTEQLAELASGWDLPPGDLIKDLEEAARLMAQTRYMPTPPDLARIRDRALRLLDSAMRKSGGKKR